MTLNITCDDIELIQAALLYFAREPRVKQPKNKKVRETLLRLKAELDSAKASLE